MNTCGKHNMNRLNTTNLNARRRGSVLLLVVAVLLLVFILGLMFMEIARLDRASTVNFTAAQDLEMVFNVAVSKIESQIKDDLGIDDVNNTPADQTDDEFFTNQEIYDYPGEQDVWLAPFDPHTDSPGQVSSIDETQWYGNVTPNADADGDGLNDAYWQPAPIPIFNGISYRVAVRTIDLSSMVNVNVATSLVDDAGEYTKGGTSISSNASRWMNPCDLDIGGMMYMFDSVTTPTLPAATPTAMAQIEALLDTRLGGVTGLPTPWVTREAYWTDVVSQNYTGYYKADSLEQFDISYRNGLHKSDLSSTLIREHLHNIFRCSATALAVTPEVSEAIYTDVDGSTDLTTYYQLNPKLYFTTISGANIYAPKFAGETGPATLYSPVVKRDLNPLLASGDSGRQQIRTEMNAVLSQGTFTPPAGMSLDQFTAQYVANLADYVDADSELTVVNDGTADHYGFEALPIVTEVYAQRYSQITAATDVGGGTSWDVTWTQQGDTGYAIEIRNPFRKPVALDTVRLVVDGVTWGMLSDANLAGQTTLDADEVLTIYRNSTGGGATEDDVSTKISAGLAKNDTANSWSVTNGPITVELRATADITGTPTVQDWPYWTVTTAQGMPDSYVENAYPYPSDPSATTVAGYRQSVTIGGDEGLDMLTVLPANYVNIPPASPGVYTEIDNLGETPKTTQVVGSLANPTQEQLVFLDDSGDTIYPNGRMSHVGDLALIAAIPLDGVKTIAEAWNSATTADDFRLNFASTELVGADDLAVPHAVLLVDRFTTLSPLEDTYDNDGDGTADAADSPIDEFFLPGTLNINTAPKDVLLRALQIPDPTYRDNLVDAIIAYREGTTRPAIAGLRTNKGFAMLGELANFDDMGALSVIIQPSFSHKNIRNSIVMDYLSNPDHVTGDSISLDREERSTVMRWLSQVCSTRSDVFLTYLRVQGVNPTDNTIMNEKRVMILFDRSKVLGAADSMSVTQQAN